MAGGRHCWCGAVRKTRVLTWCLSAGDSCQRTFWHWPLPATRRANERHGRQVQAEGRHLWIELFASMFLRIHRIEAGHISYFRGYHLMQQTSKSSTFSIIKKWGWMKVLKQGWCRRIIDTESSGLSAGYTTPELAERPLQPRFRRYDIYRDIGRAGRRAVDQTVLFYIPAVQVTPRCWRIIRTVRYIPPVDEYQYQYNTASCRLPEQ